MENGASDLGTSGIEFFYNPRSIAIVGASSDPYKPSGRPLAVCPYQTWLSITKMS